MLPSILFEKIDTIFMLSMVQTVAGRELRAGDFRRRDGLLE